MYTASVPYLGSPSIPLLATNCASHQSRLSQGPIQGCYRWPRASLSSHCCIGYRYPTTGALYTWSFLINGEEQRVVAKCAIVVIDPETSCEAAALGLGVLQTGCNYAVPYLADGRLKLVMEQFIATTRTIYLCYPSREHIPHRVRAFIDQALGSLGRNRFMLKLAAKT